MNFTQVLGLIIQGFIDLVFAIPRLVLWLFELFQAESKAAEARPSLLQIENQLSEAGLLKEFQSSLKGIADIKTEAGKVVESSGLEGISNNKELFLEYVSRKVAAPDFPLDSFSIDFAMFGKSSDLLFMVI